MIKGLSDKLKELRVSNSLTQKEVADKIGISASVVSGYETGERTPSTEILLALSYLYHCSTDYLLGKTDDKPTTVIDIAGLTKSQAEAVSFLIKTIKEGR